MGVELLSGGAAWGEFRWGEPWEKLYMLDEGLTLTNNPIDIKLDTRDILFNDGAKSACDHLKARHLTVSGAVICDSRAECRALCDEIRYQCSLPNLRLRLDGAPEWTYITSLVSITEEPVLGLNREDFHITITFQQDNPFWYSETMQTYSVAMAGNGIITVNGLTGGKLCQRGNSPVITVTSPAAGSLAAGFTLCNLTDGALQFSYTDPYLKNGAVAVIDNMLGAINRQVTVDGATVTTAGTRYFQGEFMRLLTQSNQIQYTGGPANVTFDWRPRWA